MMNEKKNTAKRRSALRIMGGLIGLVKPLLHIMMAAIILGTMGYLCAIFLTILAGQVIVHGLLTGAAGTSLSVQNMWLVHTPGKNDTHGDDRDRGAARHSALCGAVLQPLYCF